MASLENRTGYWNIVFYFGGRKYNRSLKTKDEKEANDLASRLERRQRLVETGDLTIPDGADIPTFLLSDGKLATPLVGRRSLILSGLFTEFFDNLPEGSHEESTLYGMKIHRRHLERILGKRFTVQNLTTADLQRYVTRRTNEKGTRGRVGTSTIQKELTTFRTVWGWAVDTDRLVGSFPRKGVRLPKANELPPFQTREEIERQTDDVASELWDCLYLTMEEIKKVLACVEENAAFPFIRPMFAFAAYTGARRAEMIRAQVTDIDFSSNIIIIRERKRVRGRITTRRVPLAPPLAKVMRAWLIIHPGGSSLFCHADPVIERSRKTAARRNGPIPLTRDEAHHHFRQTLDDTDWRVIRGWHCFRHSFISNCASKGIDQRMIDEWVGHTTEGMRCRYRHLFPSVQQDAMKLLFR